MRVGRRRSVGLGPHPTYSTGNHLFGVEGRRRLSIVRGPHRMWRAPEITSTTARGARVDRGEASPCLFFAVLIGSCGGMAAHKRAKCHTQREHCRRDFRPGISP